MDKVDTKKKTIEKATGKKIDKEKKQKKTIIEVKNLSKVFDVPTEKRDSVKSYFVNPFHRAKNRKFVALDDLTFTVEEGDFLGVMGRNGSGKSTLLKIISGVYAPSRGKVDVKGSLIPFLSLGVGFNPQLTGRENIYLNGTILGLTRKEIDKKFDDIVHFAELEDFIDLQIKNYSSGMVVRLGFSIAMEVKADIFVLDEVMAVGDASFKQKSLAKMQELLSGGATVIYVSHSDSQIKNYCNRVLLLEQGKKIYEGAVDEGIAIYKKLLDDRDRARREKSDDVKQKEGYAYPLEVVSLQLLDEKNEPIKKLNFGAEYTLRLKLKADRDLKKPKLAINISDDPENLIFGFNTKQRKPLPAMKSGQIVTVEYKDKMVLRPGQYTLKLKTAGDKDRLKIIPWMKQDLDFRVEETENSHGWTYFDAAGNLDYTLDQ